MLDDGGDHDVVGTQAQTVGEVVDGFGGVPADDGHVAAVGVAACEGEGGGAGRLVGGSGQP